MNTDINGLTAGLVDLAESPAPPSGVDVHAAVRAGRSRLLRRRFAVLGAATAVAVGAATLATALPGDGPTVLGPAVTMSGSPSSTPSPTSTDSPASHNQVTGHPSSSQTTASYSGGDPMTAEAKFGWLPDSATTVAYRLEYNGMSARASGDIGSNPPFFTLTVYPAGTTPQLGTFPNGAKEIRLDSPPVNGREAYRVSSDDPALAGAGDTLRWQTADGRWAELKSLYLKGDDRQQVPLRIAAGVTVQPRQIPLPFRVNGVPEGFKVSGAAYEVTKGSPWTASLNFSTGDSYVTTTVRPAGAAAAEASAHPGSVVQGATEPTCTTANGLEACVAFGKSSALDSVGGPHGWLSKLTLLGTDESKWTTEVLG